MKTEPPRFIDPASKEAKSGFNASGASLSSKGRFRPGMPLVVKHRIRSVLSLNVYTTSVNNSASWLPIPVFGSRTWM